MEKTDHRFHLIEAPVIADQILKNYKRDRLYFEQYSTKFDDKFLILFEEMVHTLFHLTPLQELKKEIEEMNEKILIVINHFLPLLNITEALMQKATNIPSLSDINVYLNQLKESVNNKCAWEIQRNCRKLVDEMELRVDELIDKGFVVRILNDFYQLMGKLKKCEVDLADVTHHHDMVATEYLLVTNQLADVLETIVESVPAALGEHDSAKREEYSIEKIMMQTQFLRSESQ